MGNFTLGDFPARITGGRSWKLAAVRRPPEQLISCKGHDPVWHSYALSVVLQTEGGSAGTPILVKPHQGLSGRRIPQMRHPMSGDAPRTRPRGHLKAVPGITFEISGKRNITNEGAYADRPRKSSR